MDGQVLALELPQTVDMEIVDTSPGIKGASASARTKPAVMSTGLSIQVPEYLSNGEKSVYISLSAAIWAAPSNALTRRHPRRYFCYIITKYLM